EDLVRVDLHTDNFNHDNGFEIRDMDTNEMKFQKALGAYPFPNWLFEDQVCLGAGNYQITIFDNWGDGLCCDSGIGFFEIFIGDEDTPSFSSSNDDFTVETFEFEIVIAPSQSPSAAPTPMPSASPSDAPSATPSDSPSNAPTECSTIVEIACNPALPMFSTLCRIISTLDLEDALSGGTWTVFAPTDDAFVALGDALDLEDISMIDRDILANVILFHAVNGTEVRAADLDCDTTLAMTNGEDSTTVCEDDKIFQEGPDNFGELRPEIFLADNGACNGVVHGVNNVMLPEGTLPSDAPSDAPSDSPSQTPTDECSTIVGNLNLADALSGGTWTVFAPTDQAFQNLDEALGDDGLDDIDQLNVILFHAVNGTEVRAADLDCDETLAMTNGEDSTTRCSGDLTTFFQIGPDNPRDSFPEITSADNEACNGVVHIVDEVMLPDDTLPQ
ncbi:MAG: hypothetical protein SGARI_000305, partial [Bacillariaceae sp.]